ncbi:MAG TPA: pyridoxamine 5'-phosphate oxidase family protein [Actinomycetes bacterium]|nr:pyridoxamine 5'-phosphate oxidase family protein [Actinomycetes bacterium]
MTNDDVAREILRAHSYVVLATVNAEGAPWASPVWFAMEESPELYWVSRPNARHSQNIEARPQIAMVVFDSTAAPGVRQAVYLTAIARQVTDPVEIEHGIAVFSRKSVREGAGAFGVNEITSPAELRLYRASVQECWILDPDVDVRISVPLNG